MITCIVQFRQKFNNLDTKESLSPKHTQSSLTLPPTLHIVYSIFSLYFANLTEYIYLEIVSCEQKYRRDIQFAMMMLVCGKHGCNKIEFFYLNFRNFVYKFKFATLWNSHVLQTFCFNKHTHNINICLYRRWYTLKWICVIFIGRKDLSRKRKFSVRKLKI